MEDGAGAYLTPSYRVTCACSRLSGPTEEPAPITQPAQHGAASDARARFHDTERADADALFDDGVSRHHRGRMRAAR